ncbi:MAG: RsmD family RNA methyltransferase [Alphaproteobacteria bacterium]|nr:RsmD family RNA methyltransferase [Alphaproteobacteria bacterium]
MKRPPLRILAGNWRGRKLAAPSAARPTSARAREALFSILLSEGALAGKTVLDACAGSGALGFEALSRGAVSVAFLERDSGALRENIESLQCAGQVVLVGRDALRPPPAPAAVDLAFFDPPWKSDPLPALVACADAGWLNSETRIVAVVRAAPNQDSRPWRPFTLVSQRASGDTRLLFLRLADAAPKSDGFDRDAAEVLHKNS